MTKVKGFGLIILAFLCFNFMGCGQRGPLYLPEQEVSAEGKAQNSKHRKSKETDTSD